MKFTFHKNGYNNLLPKDKNENLQNRFRKNLRINLKINMKINMHELILHYNKYTLKRNRIDVHTKYITYVHTKMYIHTDVIYNIQNILVI